MPFRRTFGLLARSILSQGGLVMDLRDFILRFFFMLPSDLAGWPYASAERSGPTEGDGGGNAPVGACAMDQATSLRRILGRLIVFAAAIASASSPNSSCTSGCFIHCLDRPQNQASPSA